MPPPELLRSMPIRPRLSLMTCNFKLQLATFQLAISSQKPATLTPMKSLNVLNKTWRIGDTRDLTDQQLKSASDADLYDSYDQTYIIDNLKWKVAGRIANSDGSTIYTLIAVKDAAAKDAND